MTPNVVEEGQSRRQLGGGGLYMGEVVLSEELVIKVGYHGTAEVAGHGGETMGGVTNSIGTGMTPGR